MFRAAFRATRVALDGRNRFPVNVKNTQTRKRNNLKRLKIIEENARIIREGRKALIARLAREQGPPADTSPEMKRLSIVEKAREMAQQMSSTSTASVTMSPPSVTTSPPSVTTSPPSVTTSPPSVTTSPPSVTTSPPSVTTSPPSVTTSPPSVTTSPPSPPTSTSTTTTSDSPQP